MPRIRKQNTKPRSDHERRLHRIAILEQRIPSLKRFSRHSKYGHWFPVAITVVEVGGSLIAIIIISRLLQSIAFPNINIPAPDIRVPSIPFPKIDLPQWLSTVLEIFFKIMPIIIAVGYAIYVGRHNKQR